MTNEGVVCDKCGTVNEYFVPFRVPNEKEDSLRCKKCNREIKIKLIPVMTENRGTVTFLKKVYPVTETEPTKRELAECIIEDAKSLDHPITHPRLLKNLIILTY